MICNKCGTNIQNGGNFCPKCGMPFTGTNIQNEDDVTLKKSNPLNNETVNNDANIQSELKSNVDGSNDVSVNPVNNFNSETNAFNNQSNNSFLNQTNPQFNNNVPNKTSNNADNINQANSNIMNYDQYKNQTNPTAKNYKNRSNSEYFAWFGIVTTLFIRLWIGGICTVISFIILFMERDILAPKLKKRTIIVNVVNILLIIGTLIFMYWFYNWLYN